MTAAASEAQTPLVRAAIHQRDGSTSPAQAMFEHLYDNAGPCPAYTGPQFGEHFSASGRDATVGYPSQVPESDEGTWPLASILACLQPTPLPLAAVSSVFVVGSGSSLSAADLRTDGGNDFPDPSTTPIVLSGGSSFEYHRPSRGSGDANGDDKVAGATNTPLDIEVFTGALLAVDATANPAGVDVGDRATFSATVPGHDPGGLSYAWTFSDGRTSTAQQPSFSYAQPGSITATVEVTDGHGGGGIARVNLTVNGGPAPTPTADPTRSGPADGSNGPAPPGTSLPHNHSPGKTNGSGGHPSTSPGPQGGKPPSTQTRPQATATPAATPGTSSGSGPGGSATGAAGASRGTQSGAGHHKPAAPDRQRRATTPDAGLERVTGRLVADVIPLSAATSPLVTETGAPRGSPPAERRHRGGAGSAGAAAGAALAVLLLLGLGAARELDVRWIGS